MHEGHLPGRLVGLFRSSGSGMSGVGSGRVPGLSTMARYTLAFATKGSLSGPLLTRSFT